LNCKFYLTFISSPLCHTFKSMRMKTHAHIFSFPVSV
jgi:hypothetical protein